MKTIVIIYLLKSIKKTTLVICCVKTSTRTVFNAYKKVSLFRIVTFTLYKHLKSISHMHIIFVNEEMKEQCQIL